MSPPLLFCLAFASQAIAINILFPSNGVNWTTIGPNKILWTYEKGTSTNGNFQLLHNGSSNFESIEGFLTSDGIIATGIDLVAESLLIQPLPCILGNQTFPPGSEYSLRVFSETPDGNATELGTSNGTFNILVPPGLPLQCVDIVNGTSTSSTTHGPTSTSSASNLNTSSPDKDLAKIIGGTIGALAACIIIGGVAFMYRRHRRGTRLTMTQQFKMKRGLSYGIRNWYTERTL